MIRLSSSAFGYNADLIKKGVCIGSASLSFIPHAYALSIHIDENEQHKGYSRMLLYTLLHFTDVVPDDILAIDADASNGFWKHIGFRDNRYGYDYKGTRRVTGKGYEKIATVRDIYSWLNRKYIQPFPLQISRL